MAPGLSNDLPARIAEITLAIKFADIPWLLAPHSIDGADKITIGDCMCRLLQLPQVFRESGYRSRRIKHNFRSVQPQDPGSLGEMPVIADVNADPCKLGLKDAIAEIAGSEIKLLPKSWMHVGDVMFAVFA